jgi:hypothetical protein
MKWDDVSNWAWILSGHSPDEMADRLISSPPDQPTFILLEILRRDISKVKTLKRLLNYAWDHLNRFEPISPSLSESQPDMMDGISGDYHTEVSLSSNTSTENAVRNQGNIGSFSEPSKIALRLPRINENSFTIMISRLLYQTRRIWPPAMVSVSHMIAPYLRSISGTKPGDPESLNDLTFARLCKINNYFLRLLALPSSIAPLKSMIYNWSAQKILLEMAGQFDPPLNLDQASYRAVFQVLAASKKSEREARSTTFRSRSWPPWRVEQDGMDAQRSQDEDLSRLTSAIMRLKETGYKPDSYEERMSILGGLDPDGTPTIQTRKLLKWRPSPPSTQRNRTSIDARLWAVRIEATRDVHEAWGAFSEFRRKSGKPTIAMYFAMFQKLNYESRRLGTGSDHGAAPGDGREVMAVSDHNFSDFYRSRLHPPSLQELYQEMRASGLRPSGRCLSFLLQHARTVDEGLHYLVDSGLDTQVVAYLVGDNSQVPSDVVVQVSGQLLTAFISLLCRFAPRVVQPLPDLNSGMKEPTQSNQSFSLLHRKILQPRPLKRHHHRLRHPLHHAAFLLSQWQPKFRPAWYALFRRLARSDVVVVRHLAMDPETICENYERAWRITRAALQEFHNCDLELDPHGFLLICYTFANYARAASHASQGRRDDIMESSRIVKAEFAKLTDESEEGSHFIPKLLHSLHGVHLHAYVRAMGLTGDHAAIISVLGWMVAHHEEMETIASQSRNGYKMLRRTFLAARAFCDRTDYEATAQSFMEQVESWGGRPAEKDVQQYIERGQLRIDGEEDGDEDEGETDQYPA